MFDAPDILLCDAFELDGDNPRPDTPRPSTPTPDHPHALRRTISHASLDTVLPPNRKGIRRRIEEIAESLKHKSAKKKHSSTQEIKNAVHGAALDPKTPPRSKAAKRGRKPALPFRKPSQRSEAESVLAIVNWLHGGVPFETDPPQTFPGHKSDSPVDVPLFKVEGEVWEDCSPVKTLSAGAHFAAEHKDTAQSPPIPKVGLNDVQLDIRASETDVTIWDGLQAPYHVYKCRLFLRCTTHSYDSVSLLDIRHTEMECTTRPAGSPYARPPALQASYEGAAPGRVTNPGELPKMKLELGIYMNQTWRKIQNDDGTWGWYRDAFVPLSPRLFDKMEYREFKLVSRVWVGEGCVEGELTFGISMLLRGLDMK